MTAERVAKLDAHGFEWAPVGRAGPRKLAVTTAAKPAATQASLLQPLASMKLPALKDELRARGHSTGGKKEELVEQLTLLRAAAKSQVQRMRRESLACAVGSNE